MKQPLNAAATAARPADGDLQGAHGRSEIGGFYLDSREALTYLRLRSLSALYNHIHRNALPYARVGGTYRFDTRELDVWMRKHRGVGSSVATITARRRLGLVERIR